MKAGLRRRKTSRNMAGLPQRIFSRSDTATAARMIKPRTIIWSGDRKAHQD